MRGSAFPSEDDTLLPTSSSRATNRFQVRIALIFSIIIGISLGLLLAVHQDHSSSSEWITAVDLGKSNAHQKSSSSSIRPGSIFLDTDENPINAHGGGFLFHNNIYYWYGEIKNGHTIFPKQMPLGLEQEWTWWGFLAIHLKTWLTGNILEMFYQQ